MNRFTLRSMAIIGCSALLLPSLAQAATLLYVTSGGGNAVRVLNTANNAEADTIALGASTPVGIAVSGTGAYVANYGSNSLSVIDVTDNALVTSVAVGSAPHSVAVSGTGVYVTNSSSASVTLIDTTDNQVVTTIAVGSGPRGIAVSGTGVYVTNFVGDSLTIIDTTDHQVVRTMSAGDGPHGIAINGTGAYLAILNSDVLSLIDTTDNQAVTTVTVGDQPHHVAINGTGAYVANGGGDSVTVVDITDNRVVTTISVGDTPVFIGINGTGAYVTNVNGNSVSVIDTTTNTVDATLSGITSPYHLAFANDATTLAPTLTAPLTGASAALCDDLTLAYALPETPLSGSVQMQFYETIANTSRYLTLNNNTGSTFLLDLENFTGVANVTGTNGGNGLVAGTYVLYLRYQDQFGNAAVTTAANLTVRLCAESSPGPAQQSGGGGVRASTLQTRQEQSLPRFPAPSIETPPAPAARQSGPPRLSPLQLRTCKRVLQWAKNDASMLARVNGRLRKQWGFACGGS